MDKLKQIEAFIAVVEHGSMAAAALTQDVTPVMIGRRINALEARLGVRLLHRSTRRIAVTEQGAVFMEQCKKALSELDRAELLVAEGRHKATGHLIVSAPAAFGRKHVAPHAPDFLRANPDVRLSFNLTDRVVNLVREGYDLGIRIGGGG
ncbi:LysR family transcriptional regulator, partial [Ralstonia solanacearum]|uniref:LysR family transcriptional regulator n=1 Tax=Ralstonia solanacearum TaxID=305 RepID=UPI0012D3FDD4